MSKEKRTLKIRHKKVRARTATIIFTLFGAFIMPRGGRISVRGLIRLIKPLGLSENAIRLALSRMSKRGWIRGHKKGRKSYYSLSKEGNKEMLAGKHWALDKEARPWDGQWRLLSYDIPEHVRHLRDILRQELHCLGYGSLGGSLWISPYDHRKTLMKFFNKTKVRPYVEIFKAQYSGPQTNQILAQKAWNIHKLENRYQKFVRDYSMLLLACKKTIIEGGKINQEECFALRFRVTAEFINIALDDPLLPQELLPTDWVGRRAKEIYLKFWKLLTPQVNKFIDSVFQDEHTVKKKGG